LLNRVFALSVHAQPSTCFVRVKNVFKVKDNGIAMCDECYKQMPMLGFDMTI